MRMAKQRRKYERLLELARQLWRADRTLRAETIRRLAAIRDSHESMVRSDPFGRRGSTRLVCIYCVTNPHPCPTWKATNQLLEQLQGAGA